MRDWFIPVGSVRRDLCWSVRRVTEVFLMVGQGQCTEGFVIGFTCVIRFMIFYRERLAQMSRALISNSKYGCSNINSKPTISSGCAEK
jgi:hypothetical protein